MPRINSDELELHIKSCGELLEQSYARFEATGCLADRDEACRWQLAMTQAIDSRGGAKVLSIKTKLKYRMDRGFD